MVKDHLKTKIAAALAQSPAGERQALWRLLREFSVSTPAAARPAVRRIAVPVAAADAAPAVVERPAAPAAGALAVACEPVVLPLEAVDASSSVAGLLPAEAPPGTPDAPPVAAIDDTSIQAVLENFKDAVLTVNGHGTIVGVNPAAKGLFASREADLCGRAIAELIPVLDSAASALETLSSCHEDTLSGMPPAVFESRRADHEAFTAEVTVSKACRGGEPFFVLCVRDVSGRLQNEQALRDSEARYRALVENAPEAIVVLDVDLGRFVDANENACQLFKMSRPALLGVGPQALSPERQPDGLPSFGLERGYIDRALAGSRPVFEWLHRDSAGQDIPCEVRLIRLPSSNARLVRASIIDIAARRRADILAHGERRVLELIAANAPLPKSLNAAVRVLEQVHPDLHVALMLLDEESEGATLRLAACGNVPKSLRGALRELPIGTGAGPCGAAASLGRQIVARDVERDPLWSGLRAAAAASGIAACCSTPIVTAGDRIHGTLAVYFPTARGPTTEELDSITRLTQLAGIALRRKQDETALRQSEARYRALFDNVVDGVFQSTLEGELMSANPALVQMLRYDSVAQFKDVGKLAEHFLDRTERERLVAELAANGRVRNFEYRLRRRDGSVVVVLENSRVVCDEQGRSLYYEGTITDITERKAAERALFNEKERAQVTLKSIGDAVVTTDAAGRVEYLNPVAEELTGWERRMAQGRRIEEIIRLADDETGDPVENPVLRCLRDNRVIGLAGNVTLIGRDGAPVAIQDSAAPIQDRAGQVVGAVMVFHDVSKERQLHRKLSYHASHDSLTGLINRREFEERLSAALQRVKDGDGAGDALLYMDLDQFKVVNDTCGHSAGDLLLRQLADVLQFQIRDSDVLARLGGDEFAVLLSDCTAEEAVRVAETLREAIGDFRFEWRDGARQVGVSIGIVPVEPGSGSVGSLLSAADVACYVAKDLGRNRIHVYEEGDAAERHQEMQWVARIGKAHEERRFELFYQPIVPIGRTRARGLQYELLLRMRNEHGELVTPTAFIPAAERYNLMPSLDRWVIDQVLEDLAYRGPDGDPYTLAINLSGTTLSDARFLERLVHTLDDAALPEGSLCFEITETAAIANLSQVVHFMQTLKARGCLLSLDDFGSGLSSLTYLKNLPVDFVKIDGQFIRNVNRDPTDASMVEAITRMARALKIRTIAERVESRAVLERLGEIGVSFAQGFFVAVPQSVSGLPLHGGKRRAEA